MIEPECKDGKKEGGRQAGRKEGGREGGKEICKKEQEFYIKNQEIKDKQIITACPRITSSTCLTNQMSVIASLDRSPVKQRARR